jgi:hypothetical protein
MLADAEGSLVKESTLAAGDCREQPERNTAEITPTVSKGSFIDSAYDWHTHRQVSHTRWDDCEIVGDHR